MPHRERQSMGLTGTVVRVLTENDHPHIIRRLGRESGENRLARGKHIRPSHHLFPQLRNDRIFILR